MSAGTHCDDGLETTVADVCDANGVCSGTTISCPVPTDCVTAFVPSGDGCTPVYADAGTACDDANVFTKEDSCDSTGICKGIKYSCGTPPSCAKALEEDGTGCVVIPEPVGTSCDDGSAGTHNDSCTESGECKGVECQKVKYLTVKPEANNLLSCKLACAAQSRESVGWLDIHEQIDLCTSLAPPGADIAVKTGSAWPPTLNQSTLSATCWVNSNGTSGLEEDQSPGVAHPSGDLLCRCQDASCPCTPGCGNSTCGVNDCGVSCGKCTGAKHCVAGSCELPPTPDLRVAFTDLYGGTVNILNTDMSVFEVGTCANPSGLDFIPPSSLVVACMGVPDQIRIMDIYTKSNETIWTEEANHHDVVVVPSGKVFASRSVYLSDSLVRVDLAGKAIFPFADPGTTENEGLATSADGTIFWGDLWGPIWTIDSDSGATAKLLDEVPNIDQVRDVSVGPDGNLYVGGLADPGTLEILTPTGQELVSVPLPAGPFGIYVAHSSVVYLLMEGTTVGSGIYTWNGGDVLPLKLGLAGIGAIQGLE